MLRWEKTVVRDFPRLLGLHLVHRALEVVDDDVVALPETYQVLAAEGE